MKNFKPWSEAAIPAVTETYSPVAHSELMYLIKQQLEERDYSLSGAVDVKQSLDGEQIAGTIGIQKDSYGGDFQQTLVFTNSYNKRLPIRLVSGARVFICSNGMIIGEIISLRKHTGDIFPALKQLITLAIDGMDKSFERTQNDVVVMKEVDLTTKLAAELIGRMYVEEQILTSQEVNEVVRQWRKPTFEDFKPNNLWSLYNHVTYALKEAAPSRKMESLKSLHEFSMQAAAELGAYV